LAKNLGILPDRWFEDRSSVAILGSILKESGIEPLNMLHDMFK
jgi:hypothetical protein